MRRATLTLALLVSLAACQQNKVEDQTAALTLATESLAQRQMQMRRFETKDESAILSACAGVLQDLGFTIDESSATAGFIVASKDRDAVEGGQVARSLLLASLAAAAGARSDAVWEKNQKIRISMVTKPARGANGIIVRVTFQRVIWNTKNQVSRVESIDDPIIYQQFFDKLSQSVFLEAHEI